MPSDSRTVPAVTVHDPARRPNLTGDLDAILVNVPAFRARLRGYDRLQVDNYVRWAETEMLSTRREVDDLAARYGLCLAEVKALRERGAESHEGRQLQQVSERIGQMLRLAADEAAALRAGAAEEAERILDEARTEAEARLHRAREVEEAAVARAAKLHADAREELAQADATLVQGRAEATRLLEEAAAERSRLAEQAAAERAAQVAAMNSELADLGSQRDQARQCLSRLAAQIGQALDALAEGLPRDVRVPQNGARQHVLSGNRVAAP